MDTEKTSELAIKAMEARGRMDKKLPMAEKKRIAATHLFKNIMTNDLKFNKKEVEEMKVEKVTLEKRKDRSKKEKEIIYTRFENKEDVVKIKRKLTGVSQEINDKVTEYVHPYTMERYKTLWPII